jgi:PAS domain S-box-containing protein
MMTNFPIRELTGKLYAQIAQVFSPERWERRHHVKEGRRIFDVSVDLIIVADSNRKFIRVSPSSASILGYDPEEMIGRSATDFIYPDDLEIARNAIHLSRGGQQTRNFEIRYAHKDGHPVTLAWTGAWSEPTQAVLS